MAVLNIVSCTCWPSVCLPWRNVRLGLLLIFWLGCCFFVMGLYVLFVYFERLALVSPIICKYFLPIHGLSFNFVYGFLYCTNELSLIRSHLFVFAFISIGLGDLRKHCSDSVTQLLLVVDNVWEPKKYIIVLYFLVYWFLFPSAL